MNSKTMSGLLAQGRSNYGRNYAKYLAVLVSVDGNSPEVIINSKENIQEKLEYYEKTYDEELRMKVKPSICIVGYHFLEDEADVMQVLSSL